MVGPRNLKNTRHEAAIAALAPRNRRAARRALALLEQAQQASNVPLVLLGTALLWFGWLGFNPGSALGASEYSAGAFLATTVAAASGMVTWLLLDLAQKGYMSTVGGCFGVVCGLVGVTPLAGYAPPVGCLVAGAASTVACYLTMRVTAKSRDAEGLNDTLDVFACHGVGGIVGMLVGHVLGDAGVNPGGVDGSLRGEPSSVGRCAAVLAIVAAYISLASWAILRTLARFTALRVKLVSKAGTRQPEVARRVPSTQPSSDLSAPA